MYLSLSIVAHALLAPCSPARTLSARPTDAACRAKIVASAALRDAGDLPLTRPGPRRGREGYWYTRTILDALWRVGRFFLPKRRFGTDVSGLGSANMMLAFCALERLIDDSPGRQSICGRFSRQRGRRGVQRNLRPAWIENRAHHITGAN